MSKYVVVYVCDSLPDQVITDGIDFNTASNLAADLTAEILLEGSQLSEESYIVQPVNEPGS